MKNEDLYWKPKGAGWKKDKASKDSSCNHQWTHIATKTKRRCHGEYVEIIRSNGHREYIGKNGGKLIFNENGKVDVYWNPTAEFAAAFGSGDRKFKLTKKVSKRGVSKLDETFVMVTNIREMFIFPSNDISRNDRACCPIGADDSQARKLLVTFRCEAWLMLSAVINGEHEKLERIAYSVKHHEESKNIKLREFKALATALKAAAEEKKGLPSRVDVLTKLNKCESAQKFDANYVREKLISMDLAWVKTRK